MRKLAVVLAVALALPAVVSAQGSVNGPVTEDQAQQQAAMARRQSVGDAWIPPRAAVMRDGKHWVGPAYRDRDLILDRPWQRGRFGRGVGANYVWLLEGGTRERFNLGGASFSLAPADYDRASDWRWDNDRVVLYPDPAHDGWYRAYNVRLGTYTHVMYLGNGRVAPRPRGTAPQRVASAAVSPS